MNKFKKMMSMTLAGCMAASALMMGAGAANVDQDKAEEALPFTIEAGEYRPDMVEPVDIQTDELPFKIEAGTLLPGVFDDEATTRAVTRPTTYAPDSYYGKSYAWTADASTTAYTWTSYIFSSKKANRFQVFSDKRFTVYPYTADGKSLGAVAADYMNGTYYVKLDWNNVNVGYYAKIQNTSGKLITKNAKTYYKVFNAVY